ncbi:MAG: hypothetical protein RL154_767 [Pseudomonadota bacterium]
MGVCKLKKAFSAIELVFVIIIIGVLSVVATPYFSRDDLALASSQLLSHIKYTQHLALSEDFYSTSEAKWYLKRWQIRFFKNNGEIFYSVFSDREMTSRISQRSDHIDSALDPLTRNPLFYCNQLGPACTTNNNLKSDDVRLTLKYNITDISVSCYVKDSLGALSGQSGAIVFDALGRPYAGILDDTDFNPYKLLLNAPCDITLTHSSGNQATIRVYPETGFAIEL